MRRRLDRAGTYRIVGGGARDLCYELLGITPLGVRAVIAAEMAVERVEGAVGGAASAVLRFRYGLDRGGRGRTMAEVADGCGLTVPQVGALLARARKCLDGFGDLLVYAVSIEHRARLRAEPSGAAK